MVKKKKKKVKKPREKLEKGLDKIIEWLKKQNPKDLAELTLMGGLAYAGYQVTKDWKGTLIGPIGLKLAQTDGIPSQIAGLTTLAVLGLCSFPGFKTPEEAIAGGVPPAIAHAGKVCDDFLKGFGL